MSAEGEAQPQEGADLARRSDRWTDLALTVPIFVVYHLGVIFLLNLEIGYLLPPAGLNLFIAAFRFNRPITTIYRAVVPFIALMILRVPFTLLIFVLICLKLAISF